MAAFQANDIVKHVKLDDWGAGKVLESLGEGKYLVFFEDAGKKIMLERFLSPASDETSVVLQAATKETDFTKHRPLKAVLDDFRELFPEGFASPEFLEHERDYKLKASEFIHAQLNKDALDALLQDDDIDEILTRATQAFNKTNLIFPNEKMALKDGFKAADAAARRDFAVTLRELLHGEGPMEDRFAAFVKALEDMDAAKWTTATYLLFLHDPEHYPYMKPRVTQSAAKAFAYPLHYSSTIRWDIYAQLIEFYHYVMDYLTGNTALQPRDMIDVQGFIWCADPDTYSDESRQVVREKRRKRLAGKDE